MTDHNVSFFPEFLSEVELVAEMRRLKALKAVK